MSASIPRWRPERGQVLLAVALLIPVLLGMAAIAVDIGSYADDKRNLQNAADAMALAAAHDLCTPNPASCTDTSAAQTAANAYAAKNNIDTSIVQLSFPSDYTAPAVRVTISHSHTFSFIGVLGVGSKDVSAVAAAVKVSPAGVGGAMPYGITQSTIDSSGYGQVVTLKYDASGGSTSGNFGAIEIDGSGSPPYLSGLEHGSPSTMCSVSMPGCSQTACQSGGAFPSACAENAPACDGPICSTETGNKIGPTGTGIQYRLDHTVSSCNTFDDVFSPSSAVADEGLSHVYVVAQRGAGGQFSVPSDLPNAKQPTDTPTPLVTNTPTPPPTSTPTRTPTPAPTNTPTRTPTPSGPTPTYTATVPATATPLGGGSGKYTLNPDCNPWAGAGQCPAPANDTGQLCSRRVVVIPIIDGFSNGHSPITIEGFALMYLEDLPNCSGNDCQVTGVFVNADVSMNALACKAGATITCNYDPTSSVHFERLIQ